MASADQTQGEPMHVSGSCDISGEVTKLVAWAPGLSFKILCLPLPYISISLASQPLPVVFPLRRAHFLPFIWMTADIPVLRVSREMEGNASSTRKKRDLFPRRSLTLNPETWASYVTSLSLSLFLYKMSSIIY